VSAPIPHTSGNPSHVENALGLDLVAQVETGIGILEERKENRLGMPPCRKVCHPGRPKSEKRQGDANWHSIPENRVGTGSQNQWFLGKNWSPMVVTVEKQPY
jgi:hypothetical protein